MNKKVSFTKMCNEMHSNALNLTEFILENDETLMNQFLGKLKLIHLGMKKHLEECTVCILKEEDHGEII